MASGALAVGHCYPTQGEALDAFYTASLPAMASGPVSYQSMYVKDSGVWKVSRFSIDSGGAMTNLGMTVAPVMNFPACELDAGFMDGQIVGWGIAGAMIAAWAFRQMRRGL